MLDEFWHDFNLCAIRGAMRCGRLHRRPRCPPIGHPRGQSEPMAASLGLTCSYNVTIGIPLYVEIVRILGQYSP